VSGATASTVVELTTCACVEHLSVHLHAEVHDCLLAVESGGVAALAELLGQMAFDVENPGCLTGSLPWFELEVFVALHNWQDPIAMHRLASFVTWALRPHRAAD